MAVSLCNSSYGCLSLHNEDGTMGETMDYAGVHTCLVCESIAVSIISFLVGEEIEFVMFCDEWVRKSQIQGRLEDLLLFQILKPEIAKFNATFR
jgi:hypothetical protein